MFDAQSYVRPFVLDEAGLTLRVLDQRKLPETEVWTEPREVEAVAVAIEDLVVRGAPAIACVAALGLAVCVQGFDDDPTLFRAQVEAACVRLANTRPTAVNLFVALREIRETMATAPSDADVSALRALILKTAKAHAEGDLASCLAMAGHGAPLLPDEGAVLTHCNAGALATAGYGTALGVLRRGREIGKRYTVLADETRPVLQGARLTAWELQHDGVPVEVIADNMAGALMASGVIKAAVVGADRIARNGDVANKIGTYTVAVLCKHHGIPFYVAAPWTTIDRSLASGADIPIEERNPSEVMFHGGTQLTPQGVGVRNPAFDVTPASLVTKIITETGNFDPGQIADA
ncbi:MAG: S-methyl-5-thioribose-1-phosphate isomerase [Nannocystaceae bacterium]|nr:S-methyl-5-thioribose-1-phosphate isomerase [Nannocystaceae bacterium]